MAKVYHADLWGVRETPDKKAGKYPWLLENDVSTTGWTELAPDSPFYLFKPIETGLLSEYHKGWKVTDMLPMNSTGVKTHRDHFAFAFRSEELLERMSDFRNPKLEDEVVRQRYSLAENAHWKLRERRDRLQRISDWKRYLCHCLYRPFDVRALYYHAEVIDRPRPEVMRHMLAGENLALLAPRQVLPAFRHAFVTRHLANFNALDTAGRFGSGPFFPLYIYPAERKDIGRIEAWPPGKGGRRPNLNPEFVRDVGTRLKLRFVTDGCGDLKETFGPEDIFHYIYAVFHSPTYRTRYAEFLKMDFPRLPLTSNRRLFRKLCKLGAELVSLHLMESPSLDHVITSYPVPGDDIVEKGHPKYLAPGEPEPGTGRALKKGQVYISRDEPRKGKKGQYFDGVPEHVWNFHIGGYQVCEKWLKDRRGRKLSYDDRLHYQKTVVALKHTIPLMAEIDSAIPSWPIE